MIVLSDKNIFISKNANNASANRQLTLIDGLIDRGFFIHSLFYGPFVDKSEKMKFYSQGKYLSTSYKYINYKLINGSLHLRLYKYLGQYFIQKKLFTEIIPECTEAHVVWLDNSIFSYKLARKIKKELPGVKLFLEQSEFLDIHNYNKGNFLQKWEGNRRQKLFEKEVLPILDGMALMTRTLLKHFENFPNLGPELLHLPMTVDLERFENVQPAPAEFQQPYIAFVGVMNDAKDGVSNLIGAFNLIKNQFLEYKVYLVGSWNYDTPIHLELIKSYGLEDRVFWMKEYSRDAIPSIIGNADLLVLPRPDSKQAQGGFPTKLGEYLATGKPVCATTVGELPDYLTDNESVFFAQPGSVESFADAMRLALSDPENARRVGLNGKLVAQREFNKDIQAKKLHQFLLELQDEKND
jgi:glycosyltransferase involved in cell wall biosynthesis